MNRNRSWFDKSKAVNQGFINYELCPAKVLHIINGQARAKNVPLGILQESGLNFSAKDGGFSSLIFDFGQEINGGIRIKTGLPLNEQWEAKFRLRFGESLSEVLNEPLNAHAIHDLCLSLPAMGEHEFGNTGFRFFRLDILDSDIEMNIAKLTAIAKERPFEYKGYFESSDKLLNDIWLTGARTVHLCCQDVILDGIKRDRLLWAGDLHPQIRVIESVFGNEEVVYRTLEKANNEVCKDGWHNGICSYTIWWLKCIWDWYFYTGDIEWLSGLKEPLVKHICRILDHIDHDGYEKLSGWRFVDWTIEHQDDHKKDQVLQALCVLAVQAGLDLSKVLDEDALVIRSQDILTKMRDIDSGPLLSKQADSLHILTNINTRWDSKVGQSSAPSNGISTWYAYYYLGALAKTNYHAAAMDMIRKYWGGMLSLGATTFWEHFDERWLENAARIDEFTKPGEIDVHSTYGEHCYKGLRHSLCHGWAAGPTAWLTNNVLGIKPLSPGCKKIMISPVLGDLDYVRGGYPLPDGQMLNVEIHNQAQGEECTVHYDCPDDVEVVVNEHTKVR